MAYIGVQPRLGNFQACDAISTSATDTFNLLVGGTAIFPQSAQHCLVSLNGVLQAPISSYTISGSTIVFASALTSADSIDFITILGDTLDLGVPSDDTVGAAQIKADLISGTTALTSAPAATDEFLVSDAGVLKRIDASLVGRGKIGQVVQTVKSDTFTSTSTTFADVTGMSVAITPSATSSKVLVMATLNVGNNTDDRWSAYRLVRGSTALSIGDTDGSRTTASAGSVRQTATGAQNLVSNMSVIYLDSPSTTSATTYKLSCKVQSGGAVLTFNRPGNASNADYVVHTASSITAIEVLA